jgi:hypothetical protein
MERIGDVDGRPVAPFSHSGSPSPSAKLSACRNRSEGSSATRRALALHSEESRRVPGGPRFRDFVDFPPETNGRRDVWETPHHPGWRESINQSGERLSKRARRANFDKALAGP